MDEYRKLKRLPGWEAMLSKALLSAARQPFQWGRCDCALMAANCVLEITGVDVAEDIRDKYDSETGAARAMLEAGYQNLLDLIETKAARHGAGDVLPSFAWRGDVGYSQMYGAAMAVKCATGWVAMSSDKGFIQMPSVSIIRAWRIP